MRRVLLDLVRERRPRPDQAHLAAHDIPQLRHFVQRDTPQDRPDPRDARVAMVDRPARALLLGADDHRPQLDELELAPALTDTLLAVEHRAAIAELDRDRRRGEERARERKPERRTHDVECTVHRVPSMRSQRSGGPKRTYRASPASVAHVTTR